MSESEEIIAIIVVIILLFLVFAGSAFTLEYFECKSKATKQGFEYSWGALQGCMVKNKGKWMDYKRILYREIGSEK